MNASKKLLMFAAAALALGAAQAQIVIGQVSPLSGVQAETGQAARDGAQLYFDKVNREGGIQGQKIILDARDDEYLPAKTVSQARAIIKEKSPVLFISTVGVANVNALLKEKVLDEANLVMVGATSGSAPMYENKRLFPVRQGYAPEFLKMLKHFHSTGVERLALVYQDDAFGKEALPLAEEFLKKNTSMKLVASVPYDRTNADLSKQAQDVNKADPQAVILMAVTKPAASFIKNFRPLAPTTAVAAISATDPESLVKEIGPVAEGVLSGLFLPHPSANRDDFVREMHETSKALGRPASNSPRFQLGYATARVVVAALREVKGPITAESVEKVLRQTKSFKLSDRLELRYDAKDKGINFIDLGLIAKDGRFVF